LRVPLRSIKCTVLSARFLLINLSIANQYLLSSDGLSQGTVELHSSGSWLSGSPIIRIGLVLQVNLSRILPN